VFLIVAVVRSPLAVRRSNALLVSHAGILNASAPILARYFSPNVGRAIVQKRRAAQAGPHRETWRCSSPTSSAYTAYADRPATPAEVIGNGCGASTNGWSARFSGTRERWNKYLGDGYGWRRSAHPSPAPSDAGKCASLRAKPCRVRSTNLNRERRHRGRGRPIRISIGLHYGPGSSSGDIGLNRLEIRARHRYPRECWQAGWKSLTREFGWRRSSPATIHRAGEGAPRGETSSSDRRLFTHLVAQGRRRRIRGVSRQPLGIWTRVPFNVGRGSLRGERFDAGHQARLFSCL